MQISISFMWFCRLIPYNNIANLHAMEISLHVGTRGERDPLPSLSDNIFWEKMGHGRVHVPYISLNNKKWTEHTLSGAGQNVGVADRILRPFSSYLHWVAIIFWLCCLNISSKLIPWSSASQVCKFTPGETSSNLVVSGWCCHVKCSLGQGKSSDFWIADGKMPKSCVSNSSSLTVYWNGSHLMSCVWDLGCTWWHLMTLVWVLHIVNLFCSARWHTYFRFLQ